MSENVNVDKQWLYNKLEAITVGVAEARVEIKGLGDHLRAVSANQKATQVELVEHKVDTDAHGLKAVEKRSHSLAEWGTLLVALAALGLSLWHH